MSGAPGWAVELYLHTLTLERLMTELQDQLNSIAGDFTTALATINTEVTAVEQQIAAGATPDLTALKQALDVANSTASRVTAVASGQPDPANPPPASSSTTADPGQPSSSAVLDGLPQTTETAPTPGAPAQF